MHGVDARTSTPLLNPPNDRRPNIRGSDGSGTSRTHTIDDLFGTIAVQRVSRPHPVIVFLAEPLQRTHSSCASSGASVHESCCLRSCSAALRSASVCFLRCMNCRIQSQHASASTTHPRALSTRANNARRTHLHGQRLLGQRGGLLCGRILVLRQRRPADLLRRWSVRALRLLLVALARLVAPGLPHIRRLERSAP